MTIEPTGEFFMHVGIAVRAWRGTLNDGVQVTALVAAVSTATDAPGGVIGLVPIPPPAAEWSPHRRYLMQRIWQLGDRLSDSEVHELATLAEEMVEQSERAARDDMHTKGIA